MVRWAAKESTVVSSLLVSPRSARATCCVDHAVPFFDSNPAALATSIVSLLVSCHSALAILFLDLVVPFDSNSATLATSIESRLVSPRSALATLFVDLVVPFGSNSATLATSNAHLLGSLAAVVDLVDRYVFDSNRAKSATSTAIFATFVPEQTAAAA